METVTEEEVYMGANMTSMKHLRFLVSLSNAMTEATTYRVTDMDWIVEQPERVTYIITADEQMWFEKKFTIRWNEFEPGSIGVNFRSSAKWSYTV